MIHRRAAFALGLAVAGLPAAAQDVGPRRAPDAGARQRVEVPSPVLTIDQDRLFLESQWGRRVQEEIEARSAALAAENRQIEAALVAEERQLTERRRTLPPAQFRPLAEAFDLKVQRLRAEQDAKTRQLSRLREEARRQFYATVGEILGDLVRDRGAVAILDRRAIFLSADAIDVTDESIARIDGVIGDGSEIMPLDFDTAATPDEPGDPATTGQPGLPATPGEPATPGQPDLPAAPAEPGAPD